MYTYYQNIPSIIEKAMYTYNQNIAKLLIRPRIIVKKKYVYELPKHR